MSTIERAGRHTSATQEATLPLVSVVIPCLNEAENIEECVTPRARRDASEHGIAGEVVVADNASEDGSAELAAAAGARVIHEPRRGYGSAYLAGFAAARGEYIVMARRRPHVRLRARSRASSRSWTSGAELVMGDRMDNIHPGAMPWLHRYVGNPILTGILNLFFRTGVQRRALRHARPAPRRPAHARPAHDRAWSSPRRWSSGPPRRSCDIRRVPDRVPPARRRVQALELPRRLAPPALPARPQPDAPVHPARRVVLARSGRS